MKIITEGKRPEDMVYRGKCNNCKTEIEFERKEAKYISDQRDGDYLSIKCPTCKEQITVDARNGSSQQDR